MNFQKLVSQILKLQKKLEKVKKENKNKLFEYNDDFIKLQIGFNKKIVTLNIDRWPFTELSENEEYLKTKINCIYEKIDLETKPIVDEMERLIRKI